MTPKPLCPNCNRALTFAPDGRSRLCELCDYKETIHKEIPPPEELVQALRFAAHYNRSREEPSLFRSNGRLLLAQAVGAVKAGDREEAYFCLEKLLHTDADDTQCAEAWLLLSQVYERPEQRRICLEQALAHQPTSPRARRAIAVLDGRLQQSDIINPDDVKSATAVADDPQPVHAEQFQCPRCAARMNYTADGQALVCGYCDYRQELGNGARPDTDGRFGFGAAEQDFIAALATARGHLQPVAMRAFHCMGCGIEFVLGPEALSMTCPYCDSVYVTEAAETRQIHPPQALLPFAFDEDQVKLALRAWFRAHKVERPRVSPIVGVYLPVWTFDVGGRGALERPCAPWRRLGGCLRQQAFAGG
jgi:DNA-directed RNA polymerase subunit RPC12/RpoP